MLATILCLLFSSVRAEGWACTRGVKACGKYQNTVNCVGSLCTACADSKSYFTMLITWSECSIC